MRATSIVPHIAADLRRFRFQLRDNIDNINTKWSLPLQVYVCMITGARKPECLKLQHAYAGAALIRPCLRYCQLTTSARPCTTVLQMSVYTQATRVHIPADGTKTVCKFPTRRCEHE